MRDDGGIVGERKWGRKAAPRFREYADQIRDFADRERDPGIRAKLLAIAEQYEALAGHLDPDDAEESDEDEGP